MTPGQEAGINVRTTVHEYGGGEYIAGEGVVYFSNFKCVPKLSGISLATCAWH